MLSLEICIDIFVGIFAVCIFFSFIKYSSRVEKTEEEETWY